MKNIIIFCIITLLFIGCDDVFTDDPGTDDPGIGYRLTSMAKKTPFSEEVYYNMTYEYTYDSQNRLSEEKQSNKFYLFDCITTHSDDVLYYDYDEQNRLTKKTIFNLLQIDQSCYFKYEYTSDNRLMLERKYNHYDELLEYIVYDYEDINEVACADPSPGEGEYETPVILYCWHKKFIDINGRLTKHEYRNEDGLAWYNTYTYQAGLLKEIWTYNSDDSVNNYRKYLHNNSRAVVREENYDPANTLTKYFTYEYDSRGIRSRRTQYDPSDNVVSFITYNYEEYQK